MDKGWHPDPDRAGGFRYWGDRDWTAFQAGGEPGRLHLRGWRRLWFGRIARMPLVFHPLAWFDCSVPMTRGHLTRFRAPVETRRHPPFDAA